MNSNEIVRYVSGCVCVGGCGGVYGGMWGMGVWGCVSVRVWVGVCVCVYSLHVSAVKFVGKTIILDNCDVSIDQHPLPIDT